MNFGPLTKRVNRRACWPIQNQHCTCCVGSCDDLSCLSWVVAVNWPL